MAVQKQDGLHTDVGLSGVDLTGQEDRFCYRDASNNIVLASSGGVTDGVISEGAAEGYHTSFNTLGNPILRVIAGQAIAADVECQVGNNGVLIAGSTNPVGRTRKAVALGAIAELRTYPTT